MRFKFIYPLLFVVLLVIPLIVFFLIIEKENQATFVAISGVSSFLFGLLATYTLKDRHVRLSKITYNASVERGELVFITEGLRIFPKAQREKVMQRIDDYFMAILDFEVKDFHKSDDQFKALFREVQNLSIKEEKQKKFYDRFLMALEKIEDTRKYSATLFEDRVTRPEWFILYFLILLIYVSLLFANSGGMVAYFIIIGLACVISYLLVVSIKLDRMKWKVDEKIFEPYAQTMETVGLLRYYPKIFVDAGEITRIYRKPKGTKFRVGDLPDYPDVKTRVIEVREV